MLNLKHSECTELRPANDNPRDDRQPDLFPAPTLSLVGINWITGAPVCVEAHDLADLTIAHELVGT